MKRSKLFIFLLALTVLFVSGCTLNKNLQLKETQLSAAEFYNSIYFKKSSPNADMEDLKVTEEDSATFLSIMLALTMSESDFLNIVCVRNLNLIELNK